MPKNLEELIRGLANLALAEDAAASDLTTGLIILRNLKTRAVVIFKEDGVMAGLPFVEIILKAFDKNLKFIPAAAEGQFIKKNTAIGAITGSARSILSVERTLLNFLQQLSGIATLTRKFVQKIKGTKAKIIDTRKTHPGLRWLEKYGVVVGGGSNHRFNLAESVLIKDNHLCLISFKKLARIFRSPKKFKTEIEIKNLAELKKLMAKKLYFDWIMLDNMKPAEMKKAVALIRRYNPKIKIEASGRVNLKNVREIVATGVDYISVGAITHSAPFLDISLEIGIRYH